MLPYTSSFYTTTANQTPRHTCAKRPHGKPPRYAARSARRRAKICAAYTHTHNKGHLLHNFANAPGIAAQDELFYTHTRHKLQFVCSASLSVMNMMSSAVQAIIDGEDAMLCCIAAGLSPLKTCTKTRAGWALLASHV